MALFRSSSEASDFTVLRTRMVKQQLLRRGIRNERVLRVMAQVPRHEFVPADRRSQAYDDSPLSIQCGQTISQPYTVALMCEVARLRGQEKVLEVGTGSGYGAAVLSGLSHSVHTIERIPQLARQAERCLENYTNVSVHLGDGTSGLPTESPFDAIIVAAGAEALPRAYIDQLADGGRIVIPISDGSKWQTMFCFTLHGDRLTVEDFGSFAFVPLLHDRKYSGDDTGE